VQTEAIVFFLGNKIKFYSVVFIFGSRSIVALVVSKERKLLPSQQITVLHQTQTVPLRGKPVHVQWATILKFWTRYSS